MRMPRSWPSSTCNASGAVRMVRRLRRSCSGVSPRPRRRSTFHEQGFHQSGRRMVEKDGSTDRVQRVADRAERHRQSSQTGGRYAGSSGRQLSYIAPHSGSMILAGGASSLNWIRPDDRADLCSMPQSSDRILGCSVAVVVTRHMGALPGCRQQQLQAVAGVEPHRAAEGGGGPERRGPLPPDFRRPRQVRPLHAPPPPKCRSNAGAADECAPAPSPRGAPEPLPRHPLSTTSPKVSAGARACATAAQSPVRSSCSAERQPWSNAGSKAPAAQRSSQTSFAGGSGALLTAVAHDKHLVAPVKAPGAGPELHATMLA